MKSRIFQLILPLLLILCAALPVAAQKVVRSHGGALTFYDTGDMAKALDAAVKNDTIFLPEAPVAGFTDTKDSTIMGNGKQSAILGAVVVAPTDTVRWQNALLDGVFVGGNIFVTKPTNGLYIRHTEFQNFQNPDFNSSLEESDLNWEIRNTLFENCYVGQYICLDSSAKNIRLINCSIYTISSYRDYWTAGEILFSNCTIRSYYPSSSYSISAINTIFRCYTSVVTTFIANKASQLVNCLFYTNTNSLPSSDYGYFTNCYNRNINSTSSKYSYDKDFLSEEGYFGNDGTVVGHNGGSLGFSLNPSLPFIQEKDIKVDEATGVLKVQLKIGGLATETEPEPTPEPTPED